MHSVAGYFTIALSVSWFRTSKASLRGNERVERVLSVAISDNLSCDDLVPVENEGTLYNVFVVGAGMAGVSVVKDLEASGEFQNIGWVEASDYIGGRMKTDTLDGTTIELGANWVQGSKGNPMHEYAKKIDLDRTKQSWNCAAIYDIGGINNDANANAQLLTNRETPWGAFETAYECLQQTVFDGLAADKSAEDILRDCGNWNPQNGLEEVIEMYTLDYEYAIKSSALSANFSFPNQYFTGEFVAKDEFVHDERGFMAIPQYIANSETALKQPMFNVAVKKVDYSEALAGIGPIKVQAYSPSIAHCEWTFLTEKLVLTPSVGVILKDKADTGGIEFEPSEEWDMKREALYRFYEMADYNKAFVKFPDTFSWKSAFEKGLEIVLLSLPQDQRGRSNVWQILDTGFPFDFLPESRIMLGTVFTEYARKYFPHTMDSKEVIADLLGPLQKIFSDVNFADMLDNGEIKFHYQDWSKNPFVAGSYEAAKVGATYDDYATFVEAMPSERAGMDKLVYISGSATCLNYYGYTHGALWAGQQTVNQILKDMGKSPLSPLADDFCSGTSRLVGKGNLKPTKARGFTN